MKKLFLGAVLGTSLFFSGCFNKDVSCSDSQVKEMVKNATQGNVIIDMMAYDVLKKDNKPITPMNLAMAKLTMTMGIAAAGDNPKIKKIVDSYKEKYKNVDFELKDIRTDSKNKEIQKVTCSATAVYYFKDYNITANVNYIVQKTDDGKKLFVEVKKFEEQ
jgi:hypothetical protein